MVSSASNKITYCFKKLLVIDFSVGIGSSFTWVELEPDSFFQCQYADFLWIHHKPIEGKLNKLISGKTVCKLSRISHALLLNLNRTPAGNQWYARSE